MRKMFTSELPTWGDGRYKGKINWKESIGHKVKGIYEDIEFEVEILDYDNKDNKHYLYIKYLNEKPFRTRTNTFLNCSIGELLGKRTSEHKVIVGQLFKSEDRDMIITEREYRDNPNNKNTKLKYYRYTCNICGWTEGWIMEANLLKGAGCGCCKGKHKTILGINTMWDTDRWMCDLGVSEEDAKTHTKCSGEKIIVTCPDCNRKRSIMISEIYTRHHISCSCGDGISYPEKIMISVLEQLHVDFTYQLTKTMFKWCRDYRYDFYLALINGITEVHGRQHYEDGGRKSKYRTLKEEIENDRIKKELALKNGIKEDDYIVIDCRKSELDFIKDNILNSRLNELFDLSIIDWNKAESFALSNLCKKACEMKRDNPNMSNVEIGKKLNRCGTTILSYLKKGTEIWDWFNYDVKEEVRKSNTRNGNLNGKQVEILKDGVSLGTFKSLSELSRKSEILYGVKLDVSNISNVIKGNRPHHKGFTFKYKEQDSISPIIPTPPSEQLSL